MFLQLRPQTVLWLISALVSLSKFVDLGINVYLKDEITAFDEQIVDFVHKLANPSVTPYVQIITQLGSSTFLLITTAIFICCLLLAKRFCPAAFLAAAGLGGTIIMGLSKAIFHRSRPILASPIAIEHGFSFPSGHSMLSTCIYGALAIVLWSLIKPLWLRIAGVCLLALLILTIGMSRIYLGVHYPSDVLGGILLAWAWLSFCRVAFSLWRQRKSK